MSQAQGNSQTGQQVFSVELREPQDGTTNGVLVLPFGLDIQTPVTLKIDEQALGQSAVFNTRLVGSTEGGTFDGMYVEIYAAPKSE